MRKRRFTEAEIVAILKEANAGRPVAEWLRKHRSPFLSGHLFQDVDVEREVGHELLQAAVLLIELAQPLDVSPTRASILSSFSWPENRPAGHWP